jgi:hypothetical protein
MADEIDLLEAECPEPPAEPHRELGSADSTARLRQVDHVDGTPLASDSDTGDHQRHEPERPCTNTAGGPSTRSR